MEQKLNVKLLENQDCCITAIDSTSIPVDSSGKINRAFIEYVIKDNNVVFNIVNEVPEASYLSTSTAIPTDSDGLHKYYKIVIPTLDYYKAGDSSYIVVTNGVSRCFYYNQRIYKPKDETTEITLDSLEDSCTRVSSLTDMWALREIDDNILYYNEERFIICRLINCFLGRIGLSLLDFVNSGCKPECAHNTVNDLARDFMFATLYVLKWLIFNKDFEEATRILNIVLSCDDYLCPQDVNVTNALGGCNCGKS